METTIEYSTLSFEAEQHSAGKIHEKLQTSISKDAINGVKCRDKVTVNYSDSKTSETEIKEVLTK